MNFVCGALLCSFVLAAVVDANPYRWKQCTHPTSSHGDHTYQAAADSAIALKVTRSGKAATTYCPGTYKLAVTFPSRRGFLLTTSAGKLGGATLCGGTRLNSQGATTTKGTTTTLAIPCSARGSIILKVTSATCSLCSYRHNQLTLKRAANCPACSG